jgi:hypothetical protein
MGKDDHDLEGLAPEATGTDGRGGSAAGGVGLRAALVLLAAAGALTAALTFAVHWLHRGDPATAASSPDDALLARLHLFQGWSRPDLALLLSGQEHGYLQPCGCSTPQRGGLLRRYNLLQTLKGRGWAVVPLDLGEVAQDSGPRDLPNVQGLIKYRYAMEARRLMGYLAVGLGATEGSLPLKEALDNWALNNPEPQVLCANLLDKANKYPGEVNDAAVTTVPGSGLKLAVVAVVGATVADAMSKDPQVQFERVRLMLDRMLAQVNAQKPDVRVLLYEGTPAEARRLIEKFTGFQVVVCQSEDDDGPSQPEIVGSTCLIKGTGHKGKNVGVLGVYRTGDPKRPYRCSYQFVRLGEEWQTPDDQMTGHPIARLMERYTQELKNGGYLQKYGQGNHRLQVEVPGVTPKYVGSGRCQSCHGPAYDVWKKSKHAHAYQTLVADARPSSAKHPSLRQFDGECVVCHVTGFGYKYGFKDETTTPKLENVGCESCHGPGSAHSNDPNNPKWYALMNPYKAPPNETAAQRQIRELRIEKDCQKCHDLDNDVHWKFDQRWPEIIHHTPKE